MNTTDIMSHLDVWRRAEVEPSRKLNETELDDEHRQALTYAASWARAEGQEGEREAGIWAERRLEPKW